MADDADDAGDAPSQLNLRSLVLGAFTLTAALAWNDAAQAGIEALYPKNFPKGTFRASLVYAVVVTALVGIIFVLFQMVSGVASDVEHGKLVDAAPEKQRQLKCAADARVRAGRG